MWDIQRNLGNKIFNVFFFEKEMKHFYMKEIACSPVIIPSFIPPFPYIIIKLEDLVTRGPSGALESAPWPPILHH